MIPELGLIFLIMAFALSVLHVAVAAGRAVGFAWTELANVSFTFSVAQCFCVTMSFVTLVMAFVENDFSVYYVAQNANTALPLYFKIGAVWGGHEGSLLLWALILSFWLLGVAWSSRTIPPTIRVTVLSVLSAILSGFLGMLLFTSNPFTRLLPDVPIQGADLNPLLQDITFMIHPPILYMGYVGLAVPFAFAIAECWNREAIPAAVWIGWVRRSALLAVAALTLGITLGSWWAYYELGWGGWWFWDPVENASLMPWIVGCAYLHMLWVSRQSPRYTSWRIVLALFAFILSLLGTFLTRSGVISTVHAFASDQSRGIYLMTFLSLVTLGASWVFLRRLPSPLDKSIAPVSKVALIFLGSILLVISTLSILLGTLYPLAMDQLNAQIISIGAPYFNTVITPIWGACLLLMAIAPYMRFDADRFQDFWLRIRKAVFPVLLVLIGIGVWCYRQESCSWIRGCGLAITAVLLIATAWQFPKIWNQPQRWGYWLAHMGVGVTALGIILSVILESEKSFSLRPGQAAELGGYTLTLEKLDSIQGANYEGIKAYFYVKYQDKMVARLTPEKRYYKARDLVTTESSLGLYRWTDFYVALGEPLDDDRWSLRFYTKPFVRFIWWGGVCIALGMLSQLWVLRKRSAVLSTVIVKEIQCNN